ncbi:SDR family oxidoreductase [Hymenobacter chitinivorans]|uniref:NAD(P)-dependent dehydrogenase (Short-subunit alcohol dehydrogenase family) n=1 Tax=Hymenobacter chitinivorans DSM 11115 TaxID=1121954 RepID=A0A2M9BSK9_9BACT|nr:SDR family oxidoreductase [Hymenobacter chitinivorans]PJJ60936.1 NAD(P)-dependent dehydrogenase (short-subunit alcohol dehydrogenase family) [Hymenobacter chitinivorans DSM 11115]
MKSALVTGANKGIGLEVAKLLAQQGFFVYLGSRSLAAGQAAVAQLRALGLTHLAAVQLDVTSPESIRAARATIGAATPGLDVLINNAGISGGMEQAARQARLEQFRSVFETNVFGVAGVTQAFLDLLAQSAQPRIVNVSTAMASLTLYADFANENFAYRFPVYQASKTALNMYTVQLAYELRDTPFKVNAVCPGYTRTDFTGHQGSSTVEEAGQRLVKYALLGPDGPTGQYFSEEYFPAPATCPW